MAKIQCKGTTSTGTPCQAPAGPNGYCFLHADPSRAKTFGQLGGLKNRRFAGIDLHFPERMGLSELKELEVETIRRFANGELEARELTAFVQAYNSLARIIAVDLESRVAALENAAHAQSVSSSAEVRSTGAGGGADRLSVATPEVVHTRSGVTVEGQPEQHSEEPCGIKITDSPSKGHKEL